jgi:hypothetical protein
MFLNGQVEFSPSEAESIQNIDASNDLVVKIKQCRIYLLMF